MILFKVLFIFYLNCSSNIAICCFFAPKELKQKYKYEFFGLLENCMHIIFKDMISDTMLGLCRYARNNFPKLWNSSFWVIKTGCWFSASTMQFIPVFSTAIKCWSSNQWRVFIIKNPQKMFHHGLFRDNVL